MSLINDMSATDALKLLDDQSSNEANASSLEYDTDDAENYFLKDDMDCERLRTSPNPEGGRIRSFKRQSPVPSSIKKVFILENIKANTWNFDDGEFGTESKESTPITMLVGAGYSIVDLAATAVVEGYVSDTDEEFDEDAVAAFGISSPEKLSSSFDSKVTLSPDIFCNEDSDCKRCLEVEPLVLDEYQMEVLLETKIKSEPEEIKPDFIDGKENLQDLKVEDLSDEFGPAKVAEDAEADTSKLFDCIGDIVPSEGLSNKEQVLVACDSENIARDSDVEKESLLKASDQNIGCGDHQASDSGCGNRKSAELARQNEAVEDFGMKPSESIDETFSEDLAAKQKPTLKSEDMQSIAGSFVDETLNKATELVSYLAKDEPNKQVSVESAIDEEHSNLITDDQNPCCGNEPSDSDKSQETVKSSESTCMVKRVTKEELFERMNKLLEGINLKQEAVAEMTCSGEGADVVDFGSQLPLKCIDEILSADLAEDEEKEPEDVFFDVLSEGNSDEQKCSNDDKMCDDDTKFWDKHMVIDSTIYHQLISWKKSIKSVPKEDSAQMGKLLEQLELLLESVDEPPNEISRSDCLAPKRDPRGYSKEDIKELRRAYNDTLVLSYDREALLDLGKSQMAQRRPSINPEKAKSVLK